jgi:NAD(P)H-dependent flavin oxidoreductase YrpB (nitropropane dioxygenase family)
MNRFAADVLGCKTPLILAPLAHLASDELIAAVTNAGGIGTLPLHQLKPEQTRERLQQIRSLTNGPIMVSFTGEWERDENLDVLLEFGVGLAMVFWWNGPRLIHRLQASGIKVGWQIGTDEQLSAALSRDSDFIIAQGLEAGGHVRSPHQLDELLSLVHDRTDCPVVAAGGINTPSRAGQIVPSAASAVMIGTRFCVSSEANNSESDRNLLINAEHESVILDTTLRGDWPCAFRHRLTTGGDLDIPERYANTNISEIVCVLPATEIITDFAKVLNQ